MPRPSVWVKSLRAVGVLAAATIGVGLPRALTAQSLADLAAWDALVVTPVGALPPRARVFHAAAPTELAFRYGRWRYDQDDAIHNDFGVTAARDVEVLRGSVALTAGYLSLSCGTCDSWLTGGAEVQSELLAKRLGDSTSDVRATLGLRLNAGAARFLGDGRATALSVAGAAVLGLAIPLPGETQLGLALMPGAGIGRFASVDETAYGTRPLIAAAAALALRHGLVIDVGFQRIVIDGGPTQVGVGVAWRFNGTR